MSGQGCLWGLACLSGGPGPRQPFPAVPAGVLSLLIPSVPSTFVVNNQEIKCKQLLKSPQRS